MKAMETFHDLIEEAKIRTVWWALVIFAVSYFLSHTSKSMLMNVPIAILLVYALRLLTCGVEIRWRVQPVGRQSYLSHLAKKQLSVDDPRLSTLPSPPKWKRKIDSPLVEVAIDDFINKILQEFVVDLWYSAITPDREAPEQIRLVIIDVLGEISRRVKEINLFDLLTRDMVDLIGDNIDLYRRNQSAIGVDVMGTLSSEERDERLKHHLMASKELHPALVSPECEYKVLQRIMGGILAVVLRPREARCPIVHCISRELLTCLVMQPILNFASPGYINELIEHLFLAAKEDRSKEVGDDQSAVATGLHHDNSGSVGVIQSGESTAGRNVSTFNQQSDMVLEKSSNQGMMPLGTSGHSQKLTYDEGPAQPQAADWARVLDAATQRRTEVLAPENLENMWTKGRNYRKKSEKHAKVGILLAPSMSTSQTSTTMPVKNSKEILTNRPIVSTGMDDKLMVRLTDGANLDPSPSDRIDIETRLPLDLHKGPSFGSEDNTILHSNGSKTQLKRSNSTSSLQTQTDFEQTIAGGSIISEEFYGPNFGWRKEEYYVKGTSDMVIWKEGWLHAPKLRCRVAGAYFEKIESKSFAVYSIAVTDAEIRTWFVKRRYSNFERLHRHLKDIPNYNLHLPPKRFLSSSTDDSFVHERCIQLDKYLQDLLSIANVAEQHEVWDFLSVSSKNYSFGKSTSVMKTLAVNVDDAMDDIVRQFKGVSDGLMRKVVGSSPSAIEASPTSGRNISWNSDDLNKHLLSKTDSSYDNTEASHYLSDHEEGVKGGDSGHEDIDSGANANGWHSDNELNSKDFSPRVIKRGQESKSLDYDRGHNIVVKPEKIGPDGFPVASCPVTSDIMEDSVGMPPEWTPPNVSVPLLNLVDKIFQLKRRGWLRRQVFWISKQILQLVMEDAIEDCLLRQIQWLRRDDVIAQGIRWVQNVLWPNGTFFLKLDNIQGDIGNSEFSQKPAQTAKSLAGNRISRPGSFESQLEAARRASDVKKMILGGTPTALVSLIGNKQYKRCAKDIYYFLQSTICIKQLAYGMLEQILVSVFPELHDVIVDIHEKMQVQPV
ncbi:uncharacterized protein LOC122658623 [Telopea speciosissima]|uniref:uncharacterized protein LOC122658623 n=1 Tax=Telopea speciosissima TaxID=54955 RepID=UPI001CC64266|nr:uncharacterized protein LOC122658623 [Telopea speciosissima]XP_043709584.1 uncharacterized protein LOC122658623 [Telopea speciosissima]